MSGLPEPARQVFFTDRDLGKLPWSALREAGFRVEAHDDHFGPLTSDVEWIPVVARRRWIVLTRNYRIRYTRQEIDMVMREGARLLVLSGRKVTHRQWALDLTAGFDTVMRFVERHQAKVHRGPPLSVTTWLTHEAWRKGLASTRSRGRVR